MNAPARFFGHDSFAMLRRADEAALAIVEAGARETAANIVAMRRRDDARDAMIMARQPWRITRVVYGGFAPAVWPAGGRTASDVLCDCCRLIATQERQRLADRWTYDPAWVRQLQVAEAALLAIITGDVEPDQPEAA